MTLSKLVFDPERFDVVGDFSALWPITTSEEMNV